MKRMARLQYNSPVVLTFALAALAALLLGKVTGGLCGAFLGLNMR